MTDAYAVCCDCPEEFADRPSARAHGEATMEPTGGPGIIASGHAFRVVNPTPEEIEHRRVTSAIDDAIYEALSSLENDVESGRLTEDDVESGLRRMCPDLLDAWQDYTL